MNDLVLSQHQIEGLTNTIENLTRPVNDIPVHRLVLRVPQDIVVINHQPITSMLLFFSSNLYIISLILTYIFI